MKESWRHFIIALAIFSAGCASSRLTVKVDVYADDPLVESLSNPDRLAAIQLALEKTNPLALEIANTRKQLMSQYKQVYQSYLRVLNAIDSRLGVDPEGATKGWVKPKKDYNDEIDRRAKVVLDRTQDALAALNRFIPIASSFRAGQDNFNLSDFFDAWNDLRDTQPGLLAALENLRQKELGMVFEEIVGSVSEGIPDSVNDALKKAPAEKLKTQEFRQRIANFKSQLKEIERLAKQITARGNKAVALLAINSQLIETATRATNPELIGKGITDAMKAALDVSAGPGPNLTPEAQEVFGQIAASYEFINTQIDRLQDPADPAWRILSALENQVKWQTYYAETEFYAEGKTDVVFVRDRLGHFRLQRGKNNPAALIQGQFKITRAVASGLVDVLAAAAGASGIPGVSAGVSKITADSSQPPDQADQQQEGGSASAMNISQDAKKEQRIQSSSKLRQAFLVHLEELRQSINDAPTGRPLSPELLENLRSTLKGFQELVESTKQEDT
jgi:hypothetical protein